MLGKLVSPAFTTKLETSQYIFDYQELLHWQLADAELPAASIVKNKKNKYFSIFFQNSN